MPGAISGGWDARKGEAYAHSCKQETTHGESPGMLHRLVLHVRMAVDSAQAVGSCRRDGQTESTPPTKPPEGARETSPAGP